MCSMEFKIALAVINLSMLVGLIVYMIHHYLQGRDRCPHCGSRKIDTIKVKGNKITSKCRKCGKLSDRYESFY